MQTYTDELKAQVVAAALAGGSTRTVAKQFGVAPSSVRGWCKDAQPTKTNSLATLDIDGIALRLIDGSVSAVGAISGVTLDEAWLRRQNAHDLAILYGVIADKLIRVLGAIKRPDDGSADSGRSSEGTPQPG